MATVACRTGNTNMMKCSVYFHKSERESIEKDFYFLLITGHNVAEVCITRKEFPVVK